MLFHSAFSSVQSLTRVQLFVTPWIAALQASLSTTNSQSSPKPKSIELVMPSNHVILCRPLLLLPSIFPSIRVFSSESAFRIRWPKYWSFSFNISPSNEHPGLISFRMDWLEESQESSPTPQFKSINSVLWLCYVEPYIGTCIPLVHISQRLYIPRLLKSLTCWWELGLLLCPGPCKQYCSEYWSASIFLKWRLISTYVARSGIPGSHGSSRFYFILFYFWGASVIFPWWLLQLNIPYAG